MHLHVTRAQRIVSTNCYSLNATGSLSVLFCGPVLGPAGPLRSGPVLAPVLSFVSARGERVRPIGGLVYGAARPIETNISTATEHYADRHCIDDALPLSPAELSFPLHCFPAL